MQLSRPLRLDPDAAISFDELLELNLEAARAFCPVGPLGERMSDGGLLRGMHKIRLHLQGMPEEARRASFVYLKECNSTDAYGEALPATFAEVFIPGVTPLAS